MRKVIIEKTIYTFDELSESAKQNAINYFAQNLFDYDWYESTYEEAERIGLKISEFDLDRNRYAKGNFQDKEKEVAYAILSEHGKTCETYKTATEYLVGLHKFKKQFKGEELSDEIENLNEDFLRSLLEDYTIILQHEADYLESEECITENIMANGYEFDENGNLA